MTETHGLGRAGMVTILAVLCSFALARPASACSCMGPIPVCQTFWTAAVVFVGDVQSIDELPPAPSPRAVAPGPPPPPSFLFLAKRVRLKVREQFAGARSDEIEILTGRGGGDCGYEFSVGGSYLVFANALPDHRLSTGICDRTKPLDQASGDLEYLRGLRTMQDTQARIYGTARFWDDVEGSSPQPVVRPFEGAKITVGGPSGRFTTSSGPDGSFEVRVPVGEYHVMAEVPTGKYAQATGASVNLSDARACADVGVAVHSDGQLVGRVVDSRGHPASGLTIEAGARLAIDQPFFYSLYQARTRPDGTFTIARMPPGAYVVGFNLERSSGTSPYPRVLDSIAPQVPAIFHLDAGKRADVGDFVLPATVALATIGGSVRRDDGASPAGATVYLSSGDNGVGHVGRPVVVDDSGHFSFTVVSGYAYWVQAFWVAAPSPDAQRIRSDSATVAAAPGVQPVVLTLKSVR